jgi:hypothetical protein
MCPNCQSKLSCSCELKTASNGTHCITAYEQGLKQIENKTSLDGLQSFYPFKKTS